MATLKYQVKKLKKAIKKSSAMLGVGDVYKGNNGDTFAVTGKCRSSLYIVNLRTGCATQRAFHAMSVKAKPSLLVIGSIDITSMQIR